MNPDIDVNIWKKEKKKERKKERIKLNPDIDVNIWKTEKKKERGKNKTEPWYRRKHLKKRKK